MDTLDWCGIALVFCGWIGFGYMFFDWFFSAFGDDA